MNVTELRTLLDTATASKPLPWRWEQPFKSWMRPKRDYVEDAHHPRSEGGIKDAGDDEVLHLGDDAQYYNSCGASWISGSALVAAVNALPALLAVAEAAEALAPGYLCEDVAVLEAALKSLKEA